MQSITRMLDEELYEAMNEAGQSITIDMRPTDLKKNQSPVELLQSALSACAAVDVVAILKKRKKTIQSFTIKSDGTRHDGYPRYFTKIHLTFVVQSPDVTVEELEKAAQLSLEKYCSVAGSLKTVITLSGEVFR